MAEPRIVEAIINWEFELPEHIIQNIQSFLTRKAAAQTSVLSKSWRRAWYNRPNIDFDYEDCPNYDGLLELAKRTIQRYELLDLKIESFRLRLHSLKYDDRDLVKTLIVKALKLCSHLSLEIMQEIGQFVIPRDVFESENLLGLSVEGCAIDIGMDYNLRCSKLKSLSLSCVVIDHSGVILNIISSCPLLENLSFNRTFVRGGYASADNGLTKLPKFLNLKCLVLCFVQLDTLFLDNLSSKFPFLKDLSIGGVSFSYREDDDDVIQISSHSLEHLNVAPKYWTPTMMFEFDVPSIRRFTYKGCFIPSVSFKSTSRVLESHLSIDYFRYRDMDPLATSWFLALSELLTALTPSKIYLSIDGMSHTCFSYVVRDNRVLPQPKVENLTVYLPSLDCCDFSDGIFQSCRPKFVTQYLLPESSKTNSDLIYKRLARANGEFSSPRNFIYGLSGLMELNVQVFDEFVAAWKDVSSKSLLEASERSGEKKKIRFRLVWRP